MLGPDCIDSPHAPCLRNPDTVEGFLSNCGFDFLLAQEHSEDPKFQVMRELALRVLSLEMTNEDSSTLAVLRLTELAVLQSASVTRTTWIAVIPMPWPRLSA